MIKKKSLKEIAKKYNTDKKTLHSYLEVYDCLFRDFDNINLLEIGIYKGESLRMWRDYFPNGEIYGIDSMPSAEIEENRIHSIIGDSTDTKTLLFLKDIGFDIIIDDGSHLPKNQLTTLRNFYPCLKKGGLYIIEDILHLEEVRKDFVQFGKCTIIDRRTIKNRCDDVLIIYEK